MAPDGSVGEVPPAPDVGPFARGVAGLAPAAPAPPQVRPPWPRRVLEGVAAYLPLLLMALLALGTWWLVKNTPLFEAGRAAAPPRHEPDYTMTGFLLQRFAANGVLRAQLEGDAMRHFPDDDTLEIDNPRIRSIAADGRVIVGTARRALANKDGSQVQLRGDAHVVRRALDGDLPVDFRSDFLAYAQETERVSTPYPVVVTQGGTEVHADAMRYDNLARIAEFDGKVRAVLVQEPKAQAMRARTATAPAATQ